MFPEHGYSLAVPYFIYQTYLGNETLRKFLVKKYKIQSCYHNREDEESVCRMLIKFVCEIADGMLFLTKERVGDMWFYNKLP